MCPPYGRPAASGWACDAPYRSRPSAYGTVGDRCVPCAARPPSVRLRMAGVDATEGELRARERTFSTASVPGPTRARDRGRGRRRGHPPKIIWRRTATAGTLQPMTTHCVDRWGVPSAEGER